MGGRDAPVKRGVDQNLQRAMALILVTIIVDDDEWERNVEN
jgi:hypothetical protein